MLKMSGYMSGSICKAIKLEGRDFTGLERRTEADFLVGLHMEDNDFGPKNIESEFGLLPIRQSVEEVNETIVFGSNHEIGFVIYVEIQIVKSCCTDCAG